MSALANVVSNQGRDVEATRLRWEVNHCQEQILRSDDIVNTKPHYEALRSAEPETLVDRTSANSLVIPDSQAHVDEQNQRALELQDEGLIADSTYWFPLIPRFLRYAYAWLTSS